MNKKTGAIILAAGKGTRMKAKKFNKVTFVIGDKPMIMHAVHLAQSVGLSPVVIVIGFAKESVKSLIQGDVIFAEQRKRLGTAHAVGVALKSLSKKVTDVLIIQGDDSAFYKKETISLLLKTHNKNKNAFTFLSILVKNPTGLGRIVRNYKGALEAIIEEKDATDKQKKIKEINPACYVISVAFLNKYLRKIEKSGVTGGYYLTSLIDIAIKNKEKIEVVKGGNLTWRGVNTGEELKEAEQLYSKVNGHGSAK